MTAPATTAEILTPAFGGTKFFREDLPLEQLRTSPLNPRKHFDAGKLEARIMGL